MFQSKTIDLNGIFNSELSFSLRKISNLKLLFRSQKLLGNAALRHTGKLPTCVVHTIFEKNGFGYLFGYSASSS